MGGLTLSRKTLNDGKQNGIGFYLSDFGIIS
jgi:hypothetical protein